MRANLTFFSIDLKAGKRLQKSKTALENLFALSRGASFSFTYARISSASCSVSLFALSSFSYRLAMSVRIFRFILRVSSSVIIL